ncbi:hypothetical protein COMNV_01777 [Commensalibacter sp. Nvir]|uniref:sugar MFS transporter n=1 Tax=Commensalibacter sp. Nvir TaxID=3069817 RepID=UPI002D2CE722|nr:hypothetical protein COMNV_01777 [Commensalibacter sp. Nvir]
MSNLMQQTPLQETQGSHRFTSYPAALSVITTVFFMWGFITCLNDILIPHLKTIFELNYTKAMLVQFTFFGAYFIMSVPGGKIVASLGYKKGIVCGLIIAAFGAFGFWPAAISHNYYVFLLALFVLATGITVLQVAANPYVTLLGPPKTSSSRLNLAQALNSLGTTIAPYLGGILILSAATYVIPADVGKSPETIQLIQTLETKPIAEIESAFKQATPESIAFSLKNVPPYVFDRLPADRISQQIAQLPPQLIGSVIGDLPTTQKVSAVSQLSAEQTEQLDSQVIVEVLDSLATIKLDPKQQQQFEQFKQNITPAIQQKVQTYRNEQAKSVQMPYAILGGVLILLAIFVAIFKLPEQNDHKDPTSSHRLRDVFHYPHAYLGALAVFFYVGGEVSVGSFMVNYLTLPEIGRMTEQLAAQYVSYFWGGAMIGRLIGSLLMIRISPKIMLSIFSIINLCLLSTTMLTTGDIAVYSVISIGLFNSIMFPTIFALAVERMGSLTEQASSLIVMAIVGGAVIPFAQGFIADIIGLHHAFILPLLCYVFILYYSLDGAKIRRAVVG